MVEYSNKIANESELSGSYSEAGYNEAFDKSPEASAADMIDSGVNNESVGKLLATNDKVMITNPMSKKRKFLKKLFLQYIRKYIANPKKYIDHPKQIRNLPSWFDDAIVLFSDEELSREQKRMIREFFYGLVQYRDVKVSSGNITSDTDETNRQLGERSPYAEEDPELTSLPRQNEMEKLDIMGIAKNVNAQNIKEFRQPSMEEYVDNDAGILPVGESYIVPKPNSANMGGVQMGRISSGFSLDNFIIPMGGRKQPVQAAAPIIPIAQPQNITRSSALATSTQNTSFKPTSIPVGNMNIDLTGFIMGNRNKTSVVPVQPVAQPAPLYRKQNRKIKPKINRWSPKLGGIIPKGITLGKISLKSKSKSDALSTIRNMGTTKKGITLANLSKGITLQSVMGKSKKTKSTAGISTIRNMDKVFAQVKNHSKNNYNASSMKLKLVSDIKSQCENAFRNNKFKTESVNMKNNYFKDVKNSFPKIRMEIEGMGDIHEKNVMTNSMSGIPGSLDIKSTQFIVKRGSMRPKSIGITEYDFDIGDIYKKRRKTPSMEEEIYYEE